MGQGCTSSVLHESLVELLEELCQRVGRQLSALLEILSFEVGQSLLDLLIKLSQVRLKDIGIAAGHFDHVASDFVGVILEAVLQVSFTHW